MFEAFTSAQALEVLAEITALVPKVLPAVVGFVAFRKGWSFIKSALMGA